MSKSKLSESDTVRFGLMEKVDCEGFHGGKSPIVPRPGRINICCNVGKRTKRTIRLRPRNLPTGYGRTILSGHCSGGWLIRLSLRPDSGALVSGHALSLTGLQFSDARGYYWIRLSSPHCPAAMVEYVITRCPETIDENSCVRSRVFMSREFAEWVCGRDKELADLLGVGVRQAVRLADEA